MRRNLITIRRSLLKSVLTVNLLSLGLLLALMYLGSRYVVSYLATSVIEQTQAKVQLQVQSLFSSVSSELIRMQNWVESGLIDLDQPDELNRLLQATFEDQSQISAVMVAMQTGREQMLLRLDDKWQMRRSPHQVADENYTPGSPGPPGTPIGTSGASGGGQEQLDYDPRTRPWFIGAMTRRKQVLGKTPVDDGVAFVHWTAPYRFFTTHQPGVTASITATNKQGQVYVIAIDLTLVDISHYTTQLKVGTHGMVIVLSSSDQNFLRDVAVIGLPHDSRFIDAKEQSRYFLKRPEELNLPVITDATQAFSQRKSNGVHPPLRFFSGGKPWWGIGRPVLFGDDLHVAVAILVPESDILGGIQWVQRSVLVLFLLILGGSIYQVIRLARRISCPIECLVQDMKRVSRGVLDEPCRVKSDVREFASLASAHEEMRQSLQSLLKLESDMQVARMIQQKTFPDRLPRFRGYDVQAWSQPADDTGGDSYDVIGLRTSDESSSGIVIDDEHPDRGLFLLADATGHGIGPALSVSQLRAMLRMAVWTQVMDIQTLEHINEQMMRDMPEGRFVTAWLGSLDIHTHQLKTFSAGQGPLLHYQARSKAFELVDVDTPPLGVISPLNVKEPEIIEMRRGDLFIVFSDGIYEAMSSEGQMFSMVRVQTIIREHVRESAQVICKAVKDAVIEHTRGCVAGDDQTVILIKRA